MTQVSDNEKDKPKLKDTHKDNRKERELRSKYICRTYRGLQLCAWILLTIGLCIVVTTFYLAIQQKPNHNEHVAIQLWNNGVDLEKTGNDTNTNGVDSQSILNKARSGTNKTGRFTINDVYEVIGRSFSGCQEKLCHIACTNVANVYASLHDAIRTSSCSSIDILLLEKQEFSSGVLRNYWRPANITIYEVIIHSSDVSVIKSNAFNTPIFKNTFMLTLSHLNITKVSSGALLGLYRLKYLTIKSNIHKFQPAIFQPVQTTLLNLKLNAKMPINGNENMFGVCYMASLVYLDLSDNYFNHSLSREFFKSTPNLKYLTITDSRIQHIEEDAFVDLAGKLMFVNLSKNLLTTLNAAVFKPILISQRISMLNLANNGWYCSCELQDFAEMYKEYRLQLMDVLYCKAPRHLYGVSIDEVDFRKENCIISSTTVQDTEEEKGYDSETEHTTTSIKTTTSKTYVGGSGMENNSAVDDLNSSEETNILKMRCFNMVSSDSQRLATSSAPFIFASDKNAELFNNELDYLQFPAPTYDFDLHLIAENNSVIVSVENPSELLVIWFSEQLESSVVFYQEKSLDYECMRYAVPELVVGPLKSNTTYTFCLLSTFRNDISPFNCLPLHVPAERHDNIWISEDNKQFTIGMLCLIFLLSTIAGALIAYFGIKTYPDLLEGSKNVLVVKKPDQSCYVATISETEYQKQASLKKTKLPALKKQASVKLPLPDTPPSEDSASPFRMSVKDLERLNSLKSASTFFEDPFPASNFPDDEYETPKICNNIYSIEQRSVPNTYGMSPRSPPPLPKRNSNVSNSPTLVINRFSTNCD